MECRIFLFAPCGGAFFRSELSEVLGANQGDW